MDSKKLNQSPSIQFAERLKFQGHKCVRVIKLKSNHNKIQWCGQESCIKNNLEYTNPKSKIQT